MVTVDVCVFLLDPPQPPTPTRANPNRSTASPLKRWRYLRVRASSQNPKPNATKMREARWLSALGCELAVEELEKLTVVLSVDPAGVSVAGLKLHTTVDG